MATQKMIEENSPSIWLKLWPRKTATSHKYTHGHTLVMGGPAHSTGASRLAAIAALRVGSGLVSIGCTDDALPIYASSLLSVMTKRVNNAADLGRILHDTHLRAVLVGPGLGVGDETQQCTLRILSHHTPCVVDADAITSFAAAPSVLFSAIKSPVILTPHEAEFCRLFGAITNRSEAVCAAAHESGATVILKGHDTLIASPDGRLTINRAASPALATAGTGDVLAGLVTGLLCQGMPAHEAACAGVWLHAQAAKILGAGMIAEDLLSAIPEVLRELLDQ
jgi:NAD(P)H-hydrate epimerase